MSVGVIEQGKKIYDLFFLIIQNRFITRNER